MARLSFKGTLETLGHFAEAIHAAHGNPSFWMPCSNLSRETHCLFDPAAPSSEPLGLLPVGATVTGWDTFLPLDSRALFTAHAKLPYQDVGVRALRDKLPYQDVGVRALKDKLPYRGMRPRLGKGG